MKGCISDSAQTYDENCDSFLIENCIEVITFKGRNTMCKIYVRFLNSRYHGHDKEQWYVANKTPKMRTMWLSALDFPHTSMSFTIWWFSVQFLAPQVRTGYNECNNIYVKQIYLNTIIEVHY
jgi:hypothetical protein